MGETLGQMQIGLGKLPHGEAVDAELLLRYVNDRMIALMNFHPWTRLNKNTSIQVPTLGSVPNTGSYSTGTVAYSAGGTTLVLSGGTFTSAMNGLRIRLNNRNEFYTFTFTNGTHGSVERPIEDPSNQTAASFLIWQAIYLMPSDLDFIQSIECPRLGQDLDQTTQEILDNLDPGRGLNSAVSGPTNYAPYQDDPSTGLPQMELYPGPVIAEGLPMRYRSKVSRFLITDTGKTFLDWINTETIFAGVEADLYALAGNISMKEVKEKDWMAGLAVMVSQDNQRIAPSPMRMADNLVQHRMDRATGNDALRESRLQRM